MKPPYSAERERQMCQDQCDEKSPVGLKRIGLPGVLERISFERESLLERLSVLDEAIAAVKENPHIARVVEALRRVY